MEELWGKTLMGELTFNLSLEEFGEMELGLPYGRKHKLRNAGKYREDSRRDSV